MFSRRRVDASHVSASTQIQEEIILAIRAWIEGEGLSQRRAAERLRIAQPNLSHLLSGRRTHSLNWLLDAWERSGGHSELRLTFPRTTARPPPFSR